MRPTILCLCLLLTMAQASASEVIRLNGKSDPNAGYAVDMLRLALEHIDKDYEIDVNQDELTQARVNEEVRTNGRFNLAFSSSSPELEESMRPIRIPLFKGLLGYRIFIIHKDNQFKFDRIETLDQLKQLSFGQGRTWGDTEILEAAGFNVIKTTKYPGLFHMVDGGRFDAFPRGVHEPFAELRNWPDLDLAIEKNLMLEYKMPFYFFVSKSNEQLAQDIELGLNRAIADGSFDEAFLNAPTVRDALKNGNMHKRRVFRIDNPMLSPETPLEREELWFNPEQAL